MTDFCQNTINGTDIKLPLNFALVDISTNHPNLIPYMSPEFPEFQNSNQAGGYRDLALCASVCRG